MEETRALLSASCLPLVASAPALYRAATAFVNHARIPFNSSYRLGARNPDTLRQQLGALDRPRLFKIIAAFNLNPAR